MKLTFVICLLTFMQVSATSLAQKITLNVKNLPFEKLLDDLTAQSGYHFVYEDQLLSRAKPATINVKNAPFSEVLAECFSDQPLTYVVDGKNIAIVARKKAPAATPVSSAIDVTGVVTDEKNQPLPGVTVAVKGTTIGAVTDKDGVYSLPRLEPNAVLIFSFIGYASQEIALNGNKQINIRLQKADSQLNEVVVVGYGSQRKATVTGSISTISAKEIKTATNANVVNLLAGKLPGLRVAQRTSEPGDYASDFDIRGFGAPLVVVDGIPRTNFTRLDPNEIESISVLKDASAAVYGVKGGNGVVLITTKRGSGKTVFNYSSTFGLSQIANSPDILNAYEYATLTNESYVNSGNPPPYSAETLEKYRTGALPSTNWLDLVIRKNAPQQQHSISASGSSDKVRYFISLGYMNDGGIYKSGDIYANRYNFRSNITADLTKDLQAEVLLNGIKDLKNTPGENTGSIFQALWSEPPTISVYANNNPNYLSNMPDATHPISITNSSYSGYTNNVNKIFNGSFALNYKVPAIEGLKARILYAYDNTSSFNKVWQKAVQVYDYDAATDTYNNTGTRNAPTKLSQYYSESTSTTAQASLEYAKTIHSSHNIKALLLVEERKQSGLAFNGSRQFSLDAVDQLYAGNTTNQAITSANIDPNVNQGVVGRVNYDYKGKYLLEGSFREDGSSKFAAGRRWGFFPAVSAGWRVSEESFLKNKISFLDNLKIRASYGKLGDDASSTYQYLTGYNYPGSNYFLNGTLVNGLGFRGLANQNLSWFTSKLANIGIDADLFSSKLHIEADVFSKKREGLLATRNLSLPATVGAGLPQENLNSDLTKGFEFSVAYRDHIGDFNFNLSGNVAYTRTKNLYIEQAAPTNSYSNWRGNGAERWNDNYFGYNVIGQFQSYDEIRNSPITDGNGNRSVLPGDLKYEDLNHDGIIDDNDVQVIGKNNNTPRMTYGFSIAAQWRGLDFNALFQGGSQFSVSYLNTIAFDGPLAWGRNGLDVFMDRWHQADGFDPNSAWIPGKYPSTRTKSGLTRPDGWNYRPSNFWLQDASYLRLKSVEIGYTLPASIVGKTGIVKSLRVYVNGFNLATWSGLSSLIDPEHTNAGFGNTYPIMKNYNFGVNLTF
nr:TonB-dependent receptor [Mucilaginibacter sp. L294]